MLKMRLFYKVVFLLIMMSAFSSCAQRGAEVQSAVSSENQNPVEIMNINDLPIPELAEAKLFQHGLPQSLETQNGISVWYVHNPMVALTSIRATFPVGAVADPAEKAGLVQFSMTMLKEGAAGRSAQLLSDAIEEIGASIYSTASQDNSALELQVMTDYLEEGLKIFADIWFRADFTPEAYTRLVKIRSNNLVQRGDSPDLVAKVAGNRDFFGPQSPYALPADGLLKTLPNIKLDDVREMAQRILLRRGVVITAVGNLEAEQFMAVLNRAIGAQSFGEAAKPAKIERNTGRGMSFNIVDKPGAAQSVIRIALPAPSLDDPMSLALKLVNIPFGGSFTGRLMQNIREDKGYSYGAYSVAASLKQDGLFIAQSSVSSDVTGAALGEFLYELRRLESGDFTQEELDRARATWQSELVQNFETQSGIVSLFSALQVNQQSGNLINEFSARIQNLSLEEFNAWARQSAKLSQASITIVGDKKMILEQCKDLNLPEPVFRTVEGEIIETR